MGPEIDADAAQGTLPGQDAVTSWSVQAERKGTGHAVAQAKDAPQGAGLHAGALCRYAAGDDAVLAELVADTLADGADLALSTFETGQPAAMAGSFSTPRAARPSSLKSAMPRPNSVH